MIYHLILLRGPDYIFFVSKVQFIQTSQLKVGKARLEDQGYFTTTEEEELQRNVRLLEI